MERRIALLHLRPGLEPAEVAVFEAALRAVEVPGIRHAHLGRHLEGTRGGGDYTWDLAFPDAASCPPWTEQIQLGGNAELFARCVARVDAVQFATQRVELLEPGITRPVKRTLFLEVDRSAPAEARARFDRVLTGMPRYIPAIRNWAYSRVEDPMTVGPRRWTHVWEQEFAELRGLREDYMMSPYHWGYVDGWFDPESPHRVVEPGVAHVFCEAPRSILAWD